MERIMPKIVIVEREVLFNVTDFAASAYSCYNVGILHFNKCVVLVSLDTDDENLIREMCNNNCYIRKAYASCGIEFEKYIAEEKSETYCIFCHKVRRLEDIGCDCEGYKKRFGR